jgi:hypothetical protein
MGRRRGCFDDMDSSDEEFSRQQRGPGIGQAAAEWRSLARMLVRPMTPQSRCRLRSHDWNRVSLIRNSRGASAYDADRTRRGSFRPSAARNQTSYSATLRLCARALPFPQRPVSSASLPGRFCLGRLCLGRKMHGALSGRCRSGFGLMLVRRIQNLQGGIGCILDVAHASVPSGFFIARLKGSDELSYFRK